MEVGNKDRIEEYLNQVCFEIKFREAHQEVKDELTSHLRELIEEHSIQGFDEKEAVDKAIEKMGAATLVGKQLNKAHRPKPEWSILLPCLFFVGIGLFVMYAIDEQGLWFTSLFQKCLIFSVLGACLMIAFFFFDYRKLEAYSSYIYWSTMVMLIFTSHIGPLINGKHWLSIGPLRIDFASISPQLFIIALAGLVNNWDWNKRLIQGVILFLAPLLIILVSGSLVAGIVYATASMILLAFSGIGRKFILAIVGSGLFITALSIINEPYRLGRLTSFFNPHADPMGSGYLNLQLSSLIKSSGWFGQGFVLESHMLPEIHTDFIFTYIIYTFGWLAGIALVSIILLFLIRIILMVSTVNSRYARLLVVGIGSIFALKFLWHLAMNLGYAPITAVGLPFLSFGGSQLIFNYVAVGVLLSIFRRKNLSNMSVER